jgi:hypothetical protein
MKVRGARALLNQPGHHSTGSIVAEVEDTRRWKKGRGRNGRKLSRGNRYGYEPNVQFSLSDCIRTIDLEVDWETASDRRNSLRKIDTLIGALQKFRQALAAEQALYEARHKAAKR